MNCWCWWLAGWRCRCCWCCDHTRVSVLCAEWASRVRAAEKLKMCAIILKTQFQSSLISLLNDLLLLRETKRIENGNKYAIDDGQLVDSSHPCSEEKTQHILDIETDTNVDSVDMNCDVVGWRVSCVRRDAVNSGRWKIENQLVVGFPTRSSSHFACCLYTRGEASEKKNYTNSHVCVWKKGIKNIFRERREFSFFLVVLFCFHIAFPIHYVELN